MQVIHVMASVLARRCDILPADTVSRLVGSALKLDDLAIFTLLSDSLRGGPVAGDVWQIFPHLAEIATRPLAVVKACLDMIEALLDKGAESSNEVVVDSDSLLGTSPELYSSSECLNKNSFRQVMFDNFYFPRV